MTLPDALDLIDKPDQLRVKFAEAVGIQKLRECGDGINEVWTKLGDRAGHKTTVIISKERLEELLPPLTLDNIAAEEAKLSDEEHLEFRLHLNWVTDELLKDSGGMKDWHRQRDSLSALQRAAAFVAVKCE